jgi:hypothetical protein
MYITILKNMKAMRLTEEFTMYITILKKHKKVKVP